MEAYGEILASFFKGNNIYEWFESWVWFPSFLQQKYTHDCQFIQSKEMLFQDTFLKHFLRNWSNKSHIYGYKSSQWHIMNDFTFQNVSLSMKSTMILFIIPDLYSTQITSIFFNPFIQILNLNVISFLVFIYCFILFFLIIIILFIEILFTWDMLWCSWVLNCGIWATV